MTVHLYGRVHDQIGIDELVDITVQNSGRIADFHIGAMIFNHFVGMKHVGADLTSPGNVFFSLVDLVKFLVFFL